MKSYYERVQDEIDGICPTKGKLQTKNGETNERITSNNYSRAD